MTRQKAFTLVEIMVVVAIIAIVGAVAANSFRSYSAKSKWGEVTPCINDTSLRLENYRNNHGTYPTTDIWDAISSDSDCSDHYDGHITVFDNGARYTIVYCDNKKSIWNPSYNDVWVVIDTSPTAIHHRNPIDELTEDVPDPYSGNIADACAPTW